MLVINNIKNKIFRNTYKTPFITNYQLYTCTVKESFLKMTQEDSFDIIDEGYYLKKDSIMANEKRIKDIKYEE